jgi:hypothetical protein
MAISALPFRFCVLLGLGTPRSDSMRSVTNVDDKRRSRTGLVLLCLFCVAVPACASRTPPAPTDVVHSLGTPGLVAHFMPSTPAGTMASFETSNAAEALSIDDAASGFDFDPKNRTLTAYFAQASGPSERQAAQRSLNQTGLFSSVTVLP